MTFADDLTNALRSRGAPCPVELTRLMVHLESVGKVWTDRNSDERFLPLIPVRSRDELWSHLAFVMPPDLVRHWLGRDDTDDEILPFIRFGADGSHIAVWQGQGGPSWVFLGSEGACFTVAERVRDLILILTLGYAAIEGRDVLALTPEEDWAERSASAHPDPGDVRAWVTATFDARYPACAADLLPYPAENDPFIARVADLTG